MAETKVAPPRIASRDEWLAERKAFLVKEKEFTRERDALNRMRRELPMVRIEKEYAFEAPDGRKTLCEMFDGRSQLIVYHFMFDPAWTEGCPGCSHVADNLPHLAHLHARDTSFVMVSRAPMATIEPFRKRMGWTVPWVSSFGSDFNYDFGVTMDEAHGPIEYNYRNKAEMEKAGQTYHMKGEQPGASVFLRDGDQTYHTYSTYGRGLDMFLTDYHYLDLTPFGRGEGWDGMPNLEGKGKSWWRHHDKYEKPAKEAGACCDEKKA